MSRSKVTALDIGSRSISVLIASSGVNDTFVIHGYGEKEYAGYYEGEFLEQDKLQDVISKAISDAQSSANSIVDKLYVGVPADFSFCKTKTITKTFGQKIKITEQELADIYQSSTYDETPENYVLLTCAPISFILDDGRKVYKPVGQKTSKIIAQLSLIYAEKSFIENINLLLKNIGITTVEYLSSPLCESLYLLSDERREEEAVLVDCGYIETSVSIVKGQGLLSLKSFAVGGAHISADLMECLHISFEEAEQLRKQLILSVIPTDKDDYEISRSGRVLPISMKTANEITSARLEMMASLIKKCVQKEGDILPPIPHYLTGGGVCYIKGGKDVLSSYLGTNLTMLYPKDVHLAKPHYSSLLGILDKAIKQESQNDGFFKNLIRKITGK